MPRFVILDHDHPSRHWDFLLESGPALRSWRLLAEPQRGQSIAAELLPDHRPIYLDYEGPVSGDRGRVSRWDAGIFDWERNETDFVCAKLSGERVNGRVELRRSAVGWTWLWS
ncbi:MAG TPA: DNA polymerase ligase N-terminal domain-containing protein [Gemmataceae bacterium]|jgi:hypothetical protein|nr:DNA polymerase ligase N-terminal domain-containing protein [Gemmataceae bacterium]